MFWKQLKTILKKLTFTSDMFKAAACLRAKGQPDVSKLCPGILSVLLGIAFIYMLISKFTELVNYKLIDFSRVYETQHNLSAPVFENISVSISPSWQNYQTWASKFYVNAKISSNSKKDVIFLELQKCAAKKWYKYSQVFNIYVMEENICIKSPEKVKLEGTIERGNINFLHIQIRRCSFNQTNHPQGICISEQEFKKNFDEMSKNKYNFYSVYIKDTTINSKKIDPIQQYLTLDFKIPYTLLTMKVLNIYLGTYTVETDTGIWPIFQELEIKKGYYITQTSVTTVPKYVDLGFEQFFGIINIYMSTEKFKYIRKIGKIDWVIAYAGGLFGLVVSFFGFFVYSYNKYTYELIVAQSSFNYEESGEKVRVSHFSFLRYVKFQIYEWIKTVFNRTPDWQDCKMIYETKDEANLFMDVEYLFRKVRLIDLAVRQLINEKQEKMLYLTEPLSLEEVAERKAYLQYYDAIIQGKLALNIEDIKSHQVRVNHLLTGVIGGTQLSFVLPTQTYTMVKPVTFTIEENELSDNFKAELERNLEIKDPIVVKTMSGFYDQYCQIRQIELDEDMQRVEMKFAQAYLHASEKVREQLLDKIPLKILFRLSSCIGKLKMQRFGSFTSIEKHMVKQNQQNKSD